MLLAAGCVKVASWQPFGDLKTLWAGEDSGSDMDGISARDLLFIATVG